MSKQQPHYSIVIPVFNSAAVVAETVRQTVVAMESMAASFEIILVNDGSQDASWDVISELARDDGRIVAIDLLRNSGQHAANLCGFRQARGAWIITMDDDLQNPPQEIAKLAAKADQGFDLVMGRFERKRHAPHRRLGSRLVRYINRKIFGQEKGLVLSNFRMIRRDVVERICAYNGSYPYIPGLCLMYSRRRANTPVAHRAREVGQSNYNLRRILSLVAAILFNYSSFPLRVVGALGGLVALVSFCLGLFYLIQGLAGHGSVPGWTTLVVLLSFLDGVLMLMLAMLGEYLIRVINQVSRADPYIVHEKIAHGGD